MAFAIKAGIGDPQAETFAFVSQKTMYGGKSIAEGDKVFVFASETEGGQGLVARGIVTAIESIAKTPGIARQTPRVSVTIRRTASATRSLGRRELKPFNNWNDGQPATELQFQILSTGDQQDRRPLGRRAGISRRLFLRLKRRALRAYARSKRTADPPIKKGRLAPAPNAGKAGLRRPFR